mmetsp:Transcript_58525/g.143179  ORF Transcript_58525/g.143179 Transcript_58525/m.143179 type:complete len:877 (+) Transcript_58525:96-2726(+)
MPGISADLFAQIKAKKGGSGGGSGGGGNDNDDHGGQSASTTTTATTDTTRTTLQAALLDRTATKGHGPPPPPSGSDSSDRKKSVKPPPSAATTATSVCPDDKIFIYDTDIESFLFNFSNKEPAPTLVTDQYGNQSVDILVPLAPCVYRMTDYTFAKKQPILLKKCIAKLNVLRCLQRERDNLNRLLWHRFTDSSHPTLEEDEFGKARFMELLSNCGVYQKVSELVLSRTSEVTQDIKHDTPTGDDKTKNPFRIPQIHVDGLDNFLEMVDELEPALKVARDEIANTQSVSFYPGLGELFCPGSKLLCYPEGMEGSPLGCSCVQSWYAEDVNTATNKTKRRFVLVVEFVVSVGEELVFVAASDVYPEFHDPSRNVPLKDLTHRKLSEKNSEDAKLLAQLQQRGEFYASVAVDNHYLEYHPNSFYPIIGGGWRNNAVRPLSKGGRVMVDVKRGIMEGHFPVRGTSDGMSDTVKEAIKLFEQSKRTGVAVPFRTAILPGFTTNIPKSKKKLLESGGIEEQADSDRLSLWQAWPMLTGFSFTARVWGKLLLGMPKLTNSAVVDRRSDSMVKRPSQRKMGVEYGGLGGEGSCSNCGYIKFQEQAFEQLVLAEDKKELIRAVARNAGGGASKWTDDFDDEDDDDDDEEVGIDVVANKGGASIFLLAGEPGSGKTLTAEAIAELLRKPLYIVTAGDLGTTASEVEKTLGSVLELCSTWDSLVLIDEADIFLEARNSAEIQRNALVCVMLRLLEYYSGCLFLTSNRSASSIDPAIASRITVMLSYPALDMNGRAKVWRNLIELVPVKPSSSSRRKLPRYRDQFSDEDYNHLAAGYSLNGRQIKNSIVLARALARERGTALSMPVLERAVTAVAGEGAAAGTSDSY